MMRILAFLIVPLMILMMPMASVAQPGGHGSYQNMPYGHFCPGMGMGPYGMRKAVRTADEAKQVIEGYFSSTGQALHCGKIAEKNLYFEAEILDQNGALVDKAIVDKRTGRIRSIY
jgi:hypothetical protein